MVAVKLTDMVEEQQGSLAPSPYGCRIADSFPANKQKDKTFY